MITPRKIKMAVFGLLGLAVVTGVFLAYRHYNGLLNTITTLEADKVTLELAVEEQSDTIDAAERTIDEWQEAVRVLQQREAQLREIALDAQAERERLVARLEALDIEGSAATDPVALEAELNHHTARMRCLLEAASGAGNTDCPD